MPLRAIARLIQTMLYARRFFPYYVYNILGGIEEDGARAFSIFFHRYCYPIQSRPRLIFDRPIHSILAPLIIATKATWPLALLPRWPRNVQQS
jgi:hypothetical protein